MKTSLKTLLILTLLFAFTLSADNNSNGENSFIISTDQVFATTSCHEPIITRDGYIEPSGCQMVCGLEGYWACSYMDCGGGTELCHRL